MTTQDVYNELIKQGFTVEFLSWFSRNGLEYPMPKPRDEDDE